MDLEHYDFVIDKDNLLDPATIDEVYQEAEAYTYIAAQPKEVEPLLKRAGNVALKFMASLGPTYPQSAEAMSWSPWI